LHGAAADPALQSKTQHAPQVLLWLPSVILLLKRHTALHVFAASVPSLADRKLLLLLLLMMGAPAASCSGSMTSAAGRSSASWHARPHCRV
jgi:hypothetical protein